MKYTSISDIGLLRKDNQDCVAVVESKHALLAILCDGIGGANAGSVASGMVTEMLKDAFLDAPAFTTIEEVTLWFNPVIRDINRAVYHESLVVPAYSGMGTTLVVCVMLAGISVAYNIGDSRIYRYENNELKPLSHDQTYAYEMYLRHEISFEEIDSHPRRNVLMNAVGIDESIRYETIEIASGWDYLLLSSDGLHGYVPHQIIEETMGGENILEIRNRLMSLSYEAGGFDNVSIILIEGDKHD